LVGQHNISLNKGAWFNIYDGDKSTGSLHQYRTLIHLLGVVGGESIPNCLELMILFLVATPRCYSLGYLFFF